MKLHLTQNIKSSLQLRKHSPHKNIDILVPGVTINKETNLFQLRFPIYFLGVTKYVSVLNFLIKKLTTIDIKVENYK